MVSITSVKAPDHLFYEPAVLTADLRSSDPVEQVFTQQLPYGTIEMKHTCFDGISIWSTKHQYNDYFLFEKHNDLDVVSLEFNLKGSYTIRHYGNVYKVKSRLHNIIYTPGVSNTFENAELQAETFKVQFIPEVFLGLIEDSNDTLKRFADNMLEGRPVVIGQQSLPVNPDLQRVIGEMQHCRYTGGLKKLYLLSKSIELLVMQAEAYHQASQPQPIYCKRKDDKERILYARDYLVQHADTPPSLSELSKVVGVNEYKLKRGFKEVFQTTAFGYLADYRLETAYQQLLENQKNISEIAFQLGYSSPQHFSSAFKKKFGITPKQAKR